MMKYIIKALRVKHKVLTVNSMSQIEYYYNTDSEMVYKHKLGANESKLLLCFL